MLPVPHVHLQQCWCGGVLWVGELEHPRDNPMHALLARECGQCSRGYVASKLLKLHRGYLQSLLGKECLFALWGGSVCSHHRLFIVLDVLSWVLFQFGFVVVPCLPIEWVQHCWVFHLQLHGINLPQGHICIHGPGLRVVPERDIQ